MMEYLIITTTVKSREDAENLAKKIVEIKLGACVQISEVKSVYKWKDKTEIAKEFKIEIKTLSENYQKLKEFIIKNHKYKLPEIIVVKIDGGYDKYLNWMKGELCA